MKSITQDEAIISERNQHIRETLILIGWIDAEPDYWKAQQSKIQVIGSNRTFNKNKEDDLKHIRKRKDGRWEYRRQINNISYQKIDRNYNIVREYAININKRLKGNMSPDKQQTFYEYAEEFYQLYKASKVGSSNQIEWKSALNNFKTLFNIPLKKCLPEDFQRYLNKLAVDHPTTAKKTYNKITAICKKAFAMGLIKINIADVIEKPDVQEKTRRGLTLLEQVQFLNYLKKEDVDIQCFCLFCLVTSARREEAHRFKPADFNRKNMTLFVNGTKTLNAPRTIQITKSFAKVLELIGEGFKHTSDYYSRKTQAIFKKMGKNDLVFHSLRHTCATNMVYLGIPTDYRKHIMGHSSILTTDRVYTHLEIGVKKSRMLLIYKDLYFTDF